MKKILSSALLGLLVACVVGFGSPGTAEASQIFLRPAYMGFFYNQQDLFGHDLFVGGNPCMDFACFVDFYWARLNSPDPTIAEPAAFTILDMLGAAPGTPSNSAFGRFSEWQRAADWYNANGRITWNGLYSYNTNTFRQDIGGDVAWYPETDTRLSIIFWNPDGSTYAIKRDCANPVGNGSTLFIPPPPPPPTVVSCGKFLPSTNEPIQNFTQMTVSMDVTYSGGPPGGGTPSNTSMAIMPQYPNAVHSVFWNSTTVTLFAGPFTPNTSGTYTVFWHVQVNETPKDCSATFVVYPPTIPVCGTAVVNPPQPEVNTPANINATGSWSGGPPTIKPGPASVTVTPAPGNVPLAGAATYSGGNVSMTTQQFTPVSAGVYTITWKFQVNEAPEMTCTDTFAVLNHPYFDVNAGDVLAGAAFSTSQTSPCAASPAPHNPDAGIVSWNSRVAPGFAGAGVDYAAFALDYIQDMATSRANANPTASALSFSNVSSGAPASVTPASGLFGGMFGSIANCVDYWGSKPPDAKLQAWVGNNVNGTPTNKYVHNGNLTLNGGNIGNGRRITLYVNGNVNLTGDINFNGNNGWSKLDQIPSFTLVVFGNIYIDESVKQLDGVYVAVPDDPTVAGNPDYSNPAKPRDSFTNPRKGTILTCAAGFSGYSTAALAANPTLCDGNGSPLTVNGSFVAAQLFLLRTLGSVTTGTPAEIFNYSPEAWLSPSDSNPIGTEYDSVVGLPPVL